MREEGNGIREIYLDFSAEAVACCFGCHFCCGFLILVTNTWNVEFGGVCFEKAVIVS